MYSVAINGNKYILHPKVFPEIFLLLSSLHTTSSPHRTYTEYYELLRVMKKLRAPQLPE